METQDSRSLGTISMKKLQTLVKSTFSKQQQQQQQGSENCLKMQPIADENTPPPDPNIQVTDPRISSSNPSKLKSSKKSLNSNQQVRVSEIDRGAEASLAPDPPVKVVVRIGPANCHERGTDHTVKKVLENEIRVGDRQFSFDSILDSSSKQEDVFRLVGEPLVKDALAGYNASILSYGQTGSGKTYTMWGPPSAMIEGHSTSRQQGIAPRVFQMLFSEIQKEKANSNGKQINYHCRCSFLEIYNGQIGDLLDPTQRNLEIKDDAKNGFYIENLSEEYVTSYDDVMQILIKGLSSRKVGTTSLNSKGSSSHIAFTCIVESWSKDAPNSFSSSKTSRISLVDLAGVERLNHANAIREPNRHGKNVKKTLSQLGHLVSILAKGIAPEDGAYRNSCLTHLLRESLGGNAKLSVICTISLDNKNHGETVSTLRFGQMVRSVKNKPVVNEITEDDVNDLSDQIRQLKEELIRAKLDVFKAGNNSEQINGRSIRESVNQLRISLNRSLMLPPIDDVLEEKVDPNEADVTELCVELDNLRRSCEENSEELSTEYSMNYASARGSSDSYFTSEHERNCLHESVEVDSTDNSSRSMMSDSQCYSTVLEEPLLSESPKVRNIHRKSVTNASIPHSNDGDVLESSKVNMDFVGKSVRQSEHKHSSLRSSKIFSGPTESLAASLKRGLEIIDYHQRNSQLNNSSVAFSFQHLTLRPSPAVDKANASVQTSSEGRPSLDRMPPSSTFLCVSCRQKVENASNDLQDSLPTPIFETNGAMNSDSSTRTKPKDPGEGAAQTDNRLKELHNVCSEQAAKIEEQNHLWEQLKHGGEFASVSKESQEKDKVQEPEIIKERCEIKWLNSEHGSTSFDIGEKEALLKEINNLKSRLQAYTESAPNKSIEKVRSSLLSRSIQLRKSMGSRDNSAEEMEKERQRWIEMESEWINLTDELRIDLESIRQHSENVEMELKLEKKCTEELDDALHRSVLCHTRMVEHYVELQEQYNDLSEKYTRIMEGVAEVKKAAARAGTKCKGSRFAKALAAELSALRVEKDKERERLKKENNSLRIQLKDTAEAVHTAGELLVRLREAEEAASVAETNFCNVQQENDRLKKQIEKLKRKHKMEMITMKQYLAESKLPESALRAMHFEESDATNNTFSENDDDQAWRAEFRSAYHDNY
ncbi:hypothetical protein Dimus_014470 [Dionaea muscipula]